MAMQPRCKSLYIQYWAKANEPLPGIWRCGSVQVRDLEDDSGVRLGAVAETLTDMVPETKAALGITDSWTGVGGGTLVRRTLVEQVVTIEVRGFVLESSTVVKSARGGNAQHCRLFEVFNDQGPDDDDTQARSSRVRCWTCRSP